MKVQNPKLHPINIHFAFEFQPKTKEAKCNLRANIFLYSTFNLTLNIMEFQCEKESFSLMNY